MNPSVSNADSSPMGSILWGALKRAERIGTMLKPYYETGYDLHVANYVAYAHTDKKLYEDEAHKTKAKLADVEKAFKLGRLLIVDGAKSFAPVALLTTGVVAYDGTTATTYTAEAEG